VWRWDQQEPFGVNVPDENPSALGVFEFPLRFPGQYADKETNLSYNYFRDYDAGIGRYAESDPLGLQAGLNTYLYAMVPLAQFDLYGLNRSTGGYRRSAPASGSATTSAAKSSSACGADGGPKFADEFTFFGVTWNFKGACSGHDRCYTLGCSPRGKCDDDFYDDMKSQCDQIPPASALGFARSACRRQAFEYYVAVVAFGRPNYNSGGCIGCP
jgi:RHS repeat-associated protein